MNIEEIKQARYELNEWLVKYTKCELQEGKDGLSYPCGTCFVALLENLGLKRDNPQYHEHNEKVDRMNEVWRAILQIRDN